MSTTDVPFALDNSTARNVLLHLQGLTRPPQRRLPPASLLELVCELGFVQVDSIQWVERAHHMILHARCQSYRPKHLARLVERERVLFENWTHDASIIPVAFYPYWKRKFELLSEPLLGRIARWQGDGFKDHLDTLLTRIENDGGVRSRELDRPAQQGPQEMWQWHDGKTALEYLWRTGGLCIATRDGFQKVYDLTRRVIPAQHADAPAPSHEEFVDWACTSALQRLGFGSAKDIAGFWDLVGLDEVKSWLRRQTPHTLMQVSVEAADKSTTRQLFARPDLEGVAAQLARPPARIRALSPFDPLIRDRNRLSWLFGFDYRIEIYVPEKKRKYGYYIFPLLEGNKLIGRIDMRAARAEDRLEVRRLWLEPGQRWSAARQTRLDKELARQARFCGLSQATWPGTMEKSIERC